MIYARLSEIKTLDELLELYLMGITVIDDMGITVIDDKNG